MISPKGYIPVSMLRNNIPKYIQNFAITYWEKFAQNRYLPWLVRPDDFVRNWLMDFCNDQLFATTGIDQTIRLDGAMVRRDRFLVDSYERHIDQTGVDILNIPSDLKAALNFCEPTTGHEFSNFVDAFGQSRYNDLIRIMAKKKGYTHPSIFICDRAFSINFEFYDHLSSVDDKHDYLDSDIHRTAKSLRPLDGYSLCVPELHYNDNWSGYWKKLNSEKKTEKLQGGATKPVAGRPRIQEDIAQVFHALYPHGREGKSWKEVHKKIEDAMGQDFSLSTLQRSIGQKDK